MTTAHTASQTETVVRRRGAPMRGATPSITFGVRLTVSEYAEIARAAGALDVTITALIRTSALITARTAPALLAQEAIAVWKASGAVSEAARVIIGLRRDLHAGSAPADLRRMVEDLAGEVAVCRDAYAALVQAHMRRARTAHAALGAMHEGNNGRSIQSPTAPKHRGNGARRDE